MYSDSFDQVVALAREAGRVTLDYFQSDFEVYDKADDSPLTQADLAADRVITAALKDFPIRSEESGHGDFVNAETFWLVDPLDGTKSFVAGHPDYTVNIALIHQGRPVWGVIDAPALGQTWWGGPGHGAFFNGEPMRASAANTPLRVLASRNHLNAATHAFIEALPAHTRVQRGSSLKFCAIAMGEADLYPRLGPCCEWDTGAGEAILMGAGGAICDLNGAPLAYGKVDALNPFFVASGKTNPVDYLPQGQQGQ